MTAVITTLGRFPSQAFGDEHWVSRRHAVGRRGVVAPGRAELGGRVAADHLTRPRYHPSAQESERSGSQANIEPVLAHAIGHLPAGARPGPGVSR